MCPYPPAHVSHTHTHTEMPTEVSPQQTRRHVSALYAQYFINALVGDLPDVAVLYFLQDCGFAVKSVATVLAVMNLPWLMGVVFGYASDYVKRRRAVILAGQIGGIITWSMAIPFMWCL